MGFYGTTWTGTLAVTIGWNFIATTQGNNVAATLFITDSSGVAPHQTHYHLSRNYILMLFFLFYFIFFIIFFFDV